MAAQDPGVVERARTVRFRLIGVGVALIAAAVVLARLHLPLGMYAFPVGVGVPLVIYGIFYSPRARARIELKRRTDLSSLEKGQPPE